VYTEAGGLPDEDEWVEHERAAGLEIFRAIHTLGATLAFEDRQFTAVFLLLCCGIATDLAGKLHARFLIPALLQRSRWTMDKRTHARTHARTHKYAIRRGAADKRGEEFLNWKVCVINPLLAFPYLFKLCRI
jgi:hypothetical protein